MRKKRSPDRSQVAYSFYCKPLGLQVGSGCQALPDGLLPQGYGDKHITLYDIRAELSCRYKDLRTAYRSPNTEEIFNMLTKETPETFYIGKCWGWFSVGGGFLGMEGAFTVYIQTKPCFQQSEAGLQCT